MSKFLVIPTQAFSANIKGKATITFEDLPWAVRLYLRFFKEKVHIICDEVSFIKTNTAMAEKNKSSRSRAIKLLEAHSESRCAMTGTLMTKSPLNVLDPYMFLSRTFFKNVNMYQFAEEYCIMMSLRSKRGCRVMISPKKWDEVKKRLLSAYNRGGSEQFARVRWGIMQDLGVGLEACNLIMERPRYSPFKNVDSLMRQVADVTITVNRSDIFDINFDRFVYEPIKRPVQLSKEARRIGNELIEVGFTDCFELGNAAALELYTRLQDVCNGFEPLSESDEGGKNRIISYRPLKENPKVDSLKELLEEIGTEDNQVVIWSARSNATQSIQEMLTKEGMPFVTYTGLQSDEQKREAEEKIVSGEARVFLANPASASFGLNCLKNVDYCVWYCVGASLEYYSQAQHRILRGQSKTLKFAYTLFVKNSVEERVHKALSAGQELLNVASGREVFEWGK